MQQLDLAISRLRLLLADVEARLQSAIEAERQSSEQLRHVVARSLYAETSLEAVLTMMADIEERRDSSAVRRRHLEMIRAAVAAELESLQLTRGVEQAKKELSNLQKEVAQLEQQAPAASSPGRAEALLEEIQRLRQLINEAAERAARTLQRPTNPVES